MIEMHTRHVWDSGNDGGVVQQGYAACMVTTVLLNRSLTAICWRLTGLYTINHTWTKEC